MPFPWLAASMAASTGAGLLSGQGGTDYPDPLKTNLVNVNPFGTALHRMMAGRYAQGLGDFGFGGQTKQGLSSLRQIMGDRGISPESGVYGAGESNVIGQAMAGAARNRQQYGLQLAGMPMQVMGTTGLNQAYGNQVWGSPEMQAIRGAMG